MIPGDTGAENEIPQAANRVVGGVGERGRIGYGAVGAELLVGRPLSLLVRNLYECGTRQNLVVRMVTVAAI